VKLILCISLLLTTVAFQGQSGAPDIPDEFILESEEDYRGYEALAKKGLAWLLDTPLDEFVEERNEVNAFALIWMSGCPYLKLDITSDVMPFLDTHPDLIYPFMHAMALYKLNHGKCEDAIQLHAEGLRGVAKVIKKSDIKKSKEIRTLLKADKKGRLIQHVEGLMRGR
jgi:hypothetical protein